MKDKDKLKSIKSLATNHLYNNYVSGANRLALESILHIIGDIEDGSKQKRTTKKAIHYSDSWDNFSYAGRSLTD